MEFGRVTEAELDNIDFSLPAEPAWNTTFLPGIKKVHAKVYIGCAKWGRPEWVGKIYLPKTKEKDFLQHYVQHYNSIELNATHYNVYGALAITKWKEKAADRDFKFCPKMYQGVTHSGNMKLKTFLSNEFLRGVAAFRKTSGRCSSR